MEKNVILGAGIAGLAANYTLEQNGVYSICYEKNKKVGGLCASFSVGEFIFDQFVHLSFTNDQEVRKIFSESAECIVHRPEAMNYADGLWIRHPIQNNLYSLPVEEKIKIISSFVKKAKIKDVDNYEKWLKYQYGTYFAEKYPMRYTRKYWGVEARNLGVEWTNGRMYVPELEELLYSALEEKTDNVFYAKEMRYPKYGGFESFFKKFINKDSIRLNKTVVRIDENEKFVEFTDGEIVRYDNLISTIPLPEFVQYLLHADANVRNAADKLMYTSGFLVSIGLKREIKFPSLWFYIYDENILPARVYSPSMKSKSNAPIGKSSLQAEIYFAKGHEVAVNPELLLSQTINQLCNMGLFQKSDIEVCDIRFIKYANVMCDKNIEVNRKIITDYVSKHKIYLAGRFGEWKYFWTDQSYLSGKYIAEELIRKGYE